LSKRQPNTLDNFDTEMIGRNLANRITENYGPLYDPKERKELRTKLLSLLLHEIPQVSKDELARSLDSALKIKVKIDWHHFLCIILSSLPGRWVKLNNNPGFGASTMLLLTDGTVMCQEEGGVRWKKLTPDSHGSYVNGTWSDLAPMHWTRRYYASAVLQDGRVIVSGGEYSNAGGWTDKTEIYNPKTDAWTEINPPPGWGGVGDAPCAVLPDGQFFMGHFQSPKTAIYDPVTDTWTAGPLKGSSSSEESWVLLPDDTVVTVRCNSSQRADKYDPASNTWVSAGTLPVNIIEISSSEIGAGVLLNNGQAIFAGATNHTALYTPPAIATDLGTWVAGPDFPNDSSGQSVGCKDTPSCLLTNGRVLIAAGPVDGTNWLSPTLFHQFDGAAITRVSDPPNASNVPFIGRMLLLPTGQVLFAAQTNEVYAYTYFSCPDPCWRPQITSAPSVVHTFLSYSLSGRLFNGMSQAVGYGDDASAATNYPLVRIRHFATGKVRYCRTFDHSTMGVATGTAIVSTNFTVPGDIEEGLSDLCVVVNGISSPCVPLYVRSLDIRDDLSDWKAWVRLIGSLADGDLWVIGPNGPIPVDPMGPRFTKSVRAARKQVLDGLRDLMKLGEEAFAERKKTAAKIKLAPDEGSPEAEEMERKAKERMHM
jgi:Kelch motif